MLVDDPCSTLAHAQRQINKFTTSSDTVNLHFYGGHTWSVDSDEVGSFRLVWLIIEAN